MTFLIKRLIKAQQLANPKSHAVEEEGWSRGAPEHSRPGGGRR